MSYVETWTFGYNTTPTDQTTQTLQAASFLMQLKAFLVAGGWSVVQSCDSTQYKTDGTDLWAALSNLVWASTGVHSWIVLKSPEGLVAGLDGSYTGDQSRLWFSIDLLVTSALVYTATFRFHRVNPGGTTSTSVCPTSTDQWGWANQQFLRSTLTATARWHFLRTAKGAFIAFTGYASAGYLPFSLCLFPVTNVKKNAAAVLDYPFAVAGWCKFYDSANGALYNFIASSSNADTTSTMYTGPYGNGLLGWAFDGSIGKFWSGFVGYHWASYSSIVSAWTVSVPYPIGAAFPNTGDAWTGSKRIDGDVPVFCTTTGKTAVIGTLSDITCAGGSYSQSTVNDDSSIEYAYVGSYWLPANVAPSL